MNLIKIGNVFTTEKGLASKASLEIDGALNLI